MEKFFLGMDIGTESVGMACTDEKYNLLRAKGKDCWAVRLFDESKTAVDRRIKRTARRRLDRRKFRIGMLQYLFSDFISDKTFFIRLNNSAYWAEDKDVLLSGSKNSLFDDVDFKDKQYHKIYPTIFHLRKALQEEDCQDIRLYYLALHHIIKYRGHFLFEGGMDEIRNITQLYNTLNATIDELFDEEKISFPIEKAEESKNILLSSTKSIRQKQQELECLFNITTPLGKEILKAICGAKIAPKNLFGDSYKEEKSFSFKELDDEKFEAMRDTFSDNFALLESMRSIFSFITFEKLLEGQPNISSAMVALYEKHGYDLKLLKCFLRENADKTYFDKMFVDPTEPNNYTHYIGYSIVKGKKIKVPKCKYEDFIKFSKQLLCSLDSQTQQTDTFIYLQNELNNNTFLPKILHADNGLFPHQINEDELKRIINKMVINFPQTKDIAQKILSIFLFRIPYYVGPLTGKNSWVKKNPGKEHIKITPWNFNEIIDKSASNEAFMRNMTSKCSYLHAEDVLPKCSIYYQKFNVLNQINKLKINDIPLTVEQKQLIYEEVCLTHTHITDKAILDLFVRKGLLASQERNSTVISGKDENINATMSSYIQLKKILGGFVDEDLKNSTGICENIILWHTLNTDKNIVCDLINKNYGNIEVVKVNLPKLKGLTFHDFGNLSKKFLTDLSVVDDITGEILSILDLLYVTNDNLNEILYNEKYGFQQKIEEENGIENSIISYEDIEKLYVSPAVRRGIYQSLIMADEYIQAIGKEPDKIFIEVTREDGEKGDMGRKFSRKTQLLTLYDDIKGIEELKEQLKEKEESDLRSERLFLYFRQLGKCMYSGEYIDLLQLNTNLYDVDHILPRTYIKDDSLDNKVLVLRKKNAEKTDIYPIPSGLVSTSAKEHWEILHKKKLISDTTYNRLIRTAPLTDDDYNGFINRQKVITDQTAKAVLELLKRKYPNTKMVYSKASNVNDFKNKFDLYKCRETNDLHHARDAYLNIVVGNVFDACFSTPWGKTYQKDDAWRLYNLKTLYYRNIKNAWIDDNKETLTLVKKTFIKCSMSVTRYAYCNKGAFYNETVWSHTDSGISAPKKAGNVLADYSKYGGYKTQTTAFFSIVQSEGKKGAIIKTIEAIPVLVSYQLQTNPNAQQEYLNSYLKNPSILVQKVKIKQCFSYNGTPIYIAGITGSQISLHPAIELFTDNKTDAYVNGLQKIIEMSKNTHFDREKKEYIIKTNRFNEIGLMLTQEQNISLYDMFIAKLSERKYQGLSGMRNFQNNLQLYRENFVQLSTFLQAETLIQILKFFKCNAETSNLTNIGGSGISGKLLINKDISNIDITLLSYSPCGLTVREKKI